LNGNYTIGPSREFQEHAWGSLPSTRTQVLRDAGAKKLNFSADGWHIHLVEEIATHVGTNSLNTKKRMTTNAIQRKYLWSTMLHHSDMRGDGDLLFSKEGET
jgi:hypothetical protein